MEGHSGSKQRPGIRLFYLNNNQLNFHLNVTWATHQRVLLYFYTLLFHYKCQLTPLINFLYLIFTHGFCFLLMLAHECTFCFIAPYILSASFPTANQFVELFSLELGANIWSDPAHHDWREPYYRWAISKAITRNSVLGQDCCPIPVSIAGKANRNSQDPFPAAVTMVGQFPSEEESGGHQDDSSSTCEDQQKRGKIRNMWVEWLAENKFLFILAKPDTVG